MRGPRRGVTAGPALARHLPAKRSIPRLLVLLSISASACTRSSPAPDLEKPCLRGPLAERIHRFLGAAADSAFNGTVLVAIADTVILHQAYGWADAARTRHVTLETPFWIASVSKQFAAAAILELREQGRLALEDSLPRFFATVPADKRTIDVHQLLTHTAGLPQRYAADGISDRDRAVAAVLASPLVTTPGTGFSYSNDAYNLIAAIVEVVAARPYETFVRQQLLAPAGMGHTGFWGPLDHEQVAARLYADVADSTLLRPNWGYRGGVGMYSTAADLYRWQRALARDLVLKPESRQRLLGVHWRREELGIAYGWFVGTSPRGTPWVWTRGYESFGHGAVLSTYPQERIVIVVLSNAGERDRKTPVSHAIAQEIATLVFSSL